MRLYPVLQPLVKWIITPIWRPTVTGNERIPASGPAIMAVSHQSAAETYFVPCTITREVHWLGKDALFKGKGPLGKVFAWLMRSVNVIPVDRSGAGKASAALDAGIAVLRGGNMLGVFPEGTRSPDGRLYRGKTGAVRLALATGAPIIPVACLGAFEAQKQGSVLPKRSPRLHTVVGEPLHISDLLAKVREGSVGIPDDVSQAEVRAMTRELMRAIQDLSGQEYVDEYAADYKRRMREDAAGAEGNTRV